MDKASILVLDDDTMITMLTKAVLSRGGYEVAAFNDPQAALEELSRRPFDLVMVDLMMPDMDGCTFIRRATAFPQTSTRRYAVLSAKTLTAEERGELSSFGAVLLTKPFDPMKLVEDVAAILAAS